MRSALSCSQSQTVTLQERKWLTNIFKVSCQSPPPKNPSKLNLSTHSSIQCDQMDLIPVMQGWFNICNSINRQRIKTGSLSQLVWNPPPSNIRQSLTSFHEKIRKHLCIEGMYFSTVKPNKPTANTVVVNTRGWSSSWKTRNKTRISAPATSVLGWTIK